MNAFLRAVEARLIREREEMMADLKPASARFIAPEVRKAARKVRALERERTITLRAYEIRAANPSLSGNDARAAARREMAREAKEDERIAAEERMRTAGEVARLVRDEGLTLREVADRLGLEDEKAAYAEWRWATRRRGGL